MWSCTNCLHLEIAPQKPDHCPVCGAGAEKLVPHEVSGIKGINTLKNLQEAFVAESKAHQRNLAFAFKAEQEGYRFSDQTFFILLRWASVSACMFDSTRFTVTDSVWKTSRKRRSIKDCSIYRATLKALINEISSC